MKTILDQRTREELIQRIGSLNDRSQRQWGSMTLFQMLKHCTIWDEWIQGKAGQVYKQFFLRNNLWENGIERYC